MSIPEPRTFWELLARRVEAAPNAIMLIDEHDEIIRFADYQAQTLRAAAELVALGIGPGSRVSFQLPTRIETVVVMGALARLGAIQNPIVPIYRESEVAFCLEETQADFLLTPEVGWRLDEAALRARVARPVARIPWRMDRAGLGGRGGEDGAVSRAALPAPPGDPDAVRWIYYTSGTTSRPKGARQTDYAVSITAAGLVARHGIRSDDRFGMAFPFTHVGGLINLLAVFHVGHTLVLLESFDPVRATAHFAKHRVRVIGGGPVFYSAFLEEQRRHPERKVLPDFRLFSGGGAPMNSALHHEVRREMGGRGCLHGFGMTECGIITTNDVADTDLHLADTEGRPIPGVELRVVEEMGAIARPYATGEVQLRGPAICRGYVDPASTAAAFDAEGWFRTGDLGFVDDEGYLTITGRMKDVIIRKGENVSAVEIEDILYAHPKVGDVAVVGLPDAERGELVCAVVTPAPGLALLGFDEMVEHFRSRQVMPQKIPERLEFMEAIPRNPTGKILKQELRRRLG